MVNSIYYLGKGCVDRGAVSLQNSGRGRSMMAKSRQIINPTMLILTHKGQLKPIGYLYLSTNIMPPRKLWK